MNEKQNNAQVQASKRLWLSVLLQAIDDLKRKGERDRALVWFESKNDEINSFIGICENLGIDPDMARGIILKRKGVK